MSNLVCPVCRGVMTEIDKGGVVIDTCTQCRGVWLDRGELEKLSNLVGSPPQRSSFLGGALPADASQRRWKRDDDDDDDDDRRYRQGTPPKRRSLLDFFD